MYNMNVVEWFAVIFIGIIFGIMAVSLMELSVRDNSSKLKIVKCRALKYTLSTTVYPDSYDEYPKAKLHIFGSNCYIFFLHTKKEVQKIVVMDNIYEQNVVEIYQNFKQLGSRWNDVVKGVSSNKHDYKVDLL